MQDRPTVHELLLSLGRFLDEEIVPATEGRRQFLARVAANVARLVDRELASEEVHLRDEWIRLRAIPGLVADQVDPGGTEALRRAIAGATADLARRIREGEVDAEGPARAAVIEHLRVTVREKLVVSNPAWLAADEGAPGESGEPGPGESRVERPVRP